MDDRCRFPLELKLQVLMRGYWELNLPFAVVFYLLPDLFTL